MFQIVYKFLVRIHIAVTRWGTDCLRPSFFFCFFLINDSIQESVDERAIGWPIIQECRINTDIRLYQQLVMIQLALIFAVLLHTLPHTYNVAVVQFMNLGSNLNQPELDPGSGPCSSKWEDRTSWSSSRSAISVILPNPFWRIWTDEPTTKSCGWHLNINTMPITLDHTRSMMVGVMQSRLITPNIPIYKVRIPNWGWQADFHCRSLKYDT